MKVKAVIMRPDRTNDIVVVPKHKIEGRDLFRYEKNIYRLHADRFQVTWIRRPPFYSRKYYATYYYIKGVTNPLPVPYFSELLNGTTKRTIYIENKDGKKNRGIVEVDAPDTLSERLEAGQNGHAEIEKVEITEADFKDVVNLGVPADELNSIFTPWFYQLMAGLKLEKWQQILFWVCVGALAGAAYIIYLLMTGTYTPAKGG